MPNCNCLEGQEAAGPERITAQSQREREDELEHEQPTRDVRVYREYQRIQNEEPQYRAFVPFRSIAEKRSANARNSFCEPTQPEASSERERWFSFPGIITRHRRTIRR